MTSMQSKRRRHSGAEQPEQLPEAVADRLAELLPEEALQDALKGLEGEQITGPGGLLSQLAGRVIQTALEAELTEHLGHPPGGVPGGSNVRNGATGKTVSTDLGPVEVRTPRDRDASFEPRLVAKRQTRLAGLDEKILGLYAGGMTVRDISHHLSELYATEISRDTISRITDAVLEDVAAWRSRPLERAYPVRRPLGRMRPRRAIRPPANAIVVSFDEKTSIAAREPARPDTLPAPGRPARRDSEYVRNGTQNLFAALQVHSGEVSGMTAPTRNQFDFIAFLDQLDDEIPEGRQVIAVLDNLSTHKNPSRASLVARAPPLAVRVHAQARLLA